MRTGKSARTRHSDSERKLMLCRRRHFLRLTSSVIPRIRRWPVFFNTSEVCRSSSIAPPRGVAFDSPQSADTTLTGESSGSVMCIVLRGSSRLGCAHAVHAAANKRSRRC